MNDNTDGDGDGYDEDCVDGNYGNDEGRETEAIRRDGKREHSKEGVF